MAKTERDGVTPAAREADLAGIRSQLKALHIEDGDMVICRAWGDYPSQDEVKAVHEVLEKAMIKIEAKKVAVITMPALFDIERIPAAKAREILETILTCEVYVRGAPAGTCEGGHDFCHRCVEYRIEPTS